jgi:hypothetical protein
MHIAHTSGVWAASIFIHNGAPQALVGCLVASRRRSPRHAERDRTKHAKKEEKARRQQERGSPQRSGEADQPVLPTASDDGR